jgi:hypothetical protein
MPRDVRGAWRRVTIVPFEAAVALLLIASGAAALCGFGLVDPIGALLPGWEALALNIMTVAAGGLVLAGVAGASAASEAAGLVMLAAVVVCRFILYGRYLGYGENFAVTGVLDASVLWAAAVRLQTIRRRLAIVRVDQSGTSR